MSDKYLPKVVLIGPIYSMSGYGEHSRVILKALMKADTNKKIELHVHPTQWARSTTNRSLFTASEQEKMQAFIQRNHQHLQAHESIAKKYDLSIQVTVPNEWILGEQVATKTIGVTAALETSFVNQPWYNTCFAPDLSEIWVVSHHAKKSIIDASKKFRVTDTEFTPIPDKAFDTTEMDSILENKIKVIPFPTREAKSENQTHLDLNLPTKFNFLSTNQWSRRKNVGALINEFVNEFRNEPDVGLVIKAHTQNHSKIDREILEPAIKAELNKYGERKCKVYFLHGNLTHEELLGLYTHPQIHAYASIAHGEGFGLPLYEAACNGLPVVYMNWGGPSDFLTLKGKSKGYLFEKIPHDLKQIGNLEGLDPKFFLPDMEWAYPREGKTATALRNMFSKYKIHKKRAAALRELLLESDTFNKDSIEDSIINRTTENIKEFNENITTRRVNMLLDGLE